jgi:serine protease AprX
VFIHRHDGHHGDSMPASGIRSGRCTTALRVGLAGGVTLATIVGAVGLRADAARTSAPPGRAPTAKVMVMAKPGQVSAAERAVTSTGGSVTRHLGLVDGFAATVNPAGVRALARSGAVRSLTPDERVKVAATPADPDPSEPTSVYTTAMKANDVWAAGTQGQNTTVAVVDTGVAPTPDLSSRLVTVQGGLLNPSGPCMNLSGESTCSDNYGHGTFVSGVVAGDGSSSGGQYKGVAPQAKVLSVKVAGRDGSTDVSNVLAAIQWVVSYRSTYNIRVLNLSLSTDSDQTYRTDPFNYAVERAWDAGIVVVVSASNRGPNPQTVSKPADDPLVVTVGSTDDRGTPGIGDDELPDFSSRGPTVPDGLTKPDVVAPGAHLMSLKAAGSTIEQQFPSTSTGAYRRGSGTSFSAAAVSGVAALMLSRNPSMTPDQVKYALMQSARPLTASSDPNAVGTGTVDAARAVLNPPAGSANQGVVRSNGTGLLQGSRGHVSVQTTGVNSTVVNGLLTAQLIVWSPTNYLLPWTPTTWVVSTWALTPLLAVRWSDDDWSGRNWGGRNWGGGDWQGAQWGSDTSTARSYGTGGDGALWFGAWG